MLGFGETFFEDQKVRFIVFQYFDGCSLYEIIEQGRLSVPMAKSIFLSLFKIVCRMHNKGVVHRDLKLDNFLINKAGEIKLIDFGFAGPFSGRSQNGYFSGEEQLGTLPYIAPEIIQGTHYKGNQVDVFAMGVVLFQLVFRFDPFQSASP